MPRGRNGDLCVENNALDIGGFVVVVRATAAGVRVGVAGGVAIGMDAEGSQQAAIR